MVEEDGRRIFVSATTSLLATSNTIDVAALAAEVRFSVALDDHKDVPPPPPVLLQLHGRNINAIEDILTHSFHHLVAIYLQHNCISSINALYLCARSLRVLNLASNVITTLPDGIFWAAFRCLSVVDISDNYVSKWRDVDGLEAATSLQLLRLSGNPLSLLEGSRQVIVNRMPFLLGLDDHTVADEERIQHARFGDRYCALHPAMHITVWAPWETRPFLPSCYADIHVSLRHTLSALHRQYERNSPVTIVQRVFRGYWGRRHVFGAFHELQAAALNIQRVFRGWAFRQYLMAQLRAVLAARGKEDLLLSTLHKQRLRAIPKIMSVWFTRRRAFLRSKAAHRIKQFLTMAITSLRALRQRFLAAPSLLNLVCSRATLPLVLQAAEIAHHREIFVLGMPRCALQDRVIESGPVVLRSSSYHFHCVYDQFRRQVLQTRCDGVFRDGVTRPTAALRFEHDLLRTDNERIAVLLEHSTQLERTSLQIQHLRAFATEVHQRLAAARGALYPRARRMRSETVHSHGHGHAVRIRARGVPKCPPFNPKALPLSVAYEKLLTFVPTSFHMYWRILYLLRRSHCYNDFILQVYTPLDVRQVLAATRIQSVFRSFWTRQRTGFHRRLLEARATFCLQRWWRNILYLRRVLDLWAHCLRATAAIDSNVVYIEERVLALLRTPSMLDIIMQAMPQRASHQWKYKFTHRAVHMPVTLEESLSRLPEDEKQSYLNTFLVESGLQRVAFPVWMPSTPTHEIVGREEKHTSLDQVGLLFSVGVNESPSQDIFPRPSLASIAAFDAAFGRFPTCLEVITDSFALWDHAGADDSAMPWGKARGVAMVRLEFESVQEARHRAVLLLMKTYDARTQTYARLFSYSMLRYLWLHKPVAARPGHVFSANWLALRLALPSKWGTFYRETSAKKPSTAMRGRRGHTPLATSTMNGRIAELSIDQMLDLTQVQLPTLEPDPAYDNADNQAEAPLAPQVEPAIVHYDFRPPEELQQLKEHQAQRIREESAYVAAALQSLATEVLIEKQIHVARQHIPRPPPPMVTEVAARNRHEKLQAKLRAVDGAVALHRRDQQRVNKALHTMRLEERATEARAVDERIAKRERAAATAAHKVAVDAALQRNEYKQQQRRLLEQQSRAVADALASRKAASHGFARHFGQQVLRLGRLQAKDDSDERKAAVRTLPVLRAAEVKVKIAETRASELVKRSHLFVERQKGRIEHNEEMREALTVQAMQDTFRLEDVRERVRIERTIRERLRNHEG
ncbi:hypothetical protein ACHHYP_13647 [Achlya hypogyna]|uniref:Uncharacterized protein n=1 Tax=Achlya hypogyna TaxID=1202772 RepID=A0A1V9ZFJ7_ACHHY|nr:hypothetical protein ACHHYP_13647 [Achlya hypogyna]